MIFSSGGKNEIGVKYDIFLERLHLHNVFSWDKKLLGIVISLEVMSFSSYLRAILLVTREIFSLSSLNNRLLKSKNTLHEKLPGHCRSPANLVPHLSAWSFRKFHFKLKLNIDCIKKRVLLYCIMMK